MEAYEKCAEPINAVTLGNMAALLRMVKAAIAHKFVHKVLQLVLHGVVEDLPWSAAASACPLACAMCA